VELRASAGRCQRAVGVLLAQASGMKYEAEALSVDGQRAYDASDAATGLRMHREQVASLSAAPAPCHSTVAAIGRATLAGARPLGAHLQHQHLTPCRQHVTHPSLQDELRQEHPDAHVLPVRLYSDGAQTGQGRSQLKHHSLTMSLLTIPAAHMKRRDSYVRIGTLPTLRAADFGMADRNAK
jgi:hypothetical protein